MSPASRSLLGACAMRTSNTAASSNAPSPLTLSVGGTAIQVPSKAQVAISVNSVSPLTLPMNGPIQMPSKTHIAVPANVSSPVHTTVALRLADNLKRGESAQVHASSLEVVETRKSAQILGETTVAPSVQPTVEADLERQSPCTLLDATSTRAPYVEFNDQTMQSSTSKEVAARKDIKLAQTPVTKGYDAVDEGTCRETTDCSDDNSFATVADDHDESEDEESCEHSDEELEQAAFSYCEAAFLPLFDSLTTAAMSNSPVEVQNVLRQIKSRVPIMSAPFMEEYEFFRLIQVAKPFDLGLYRSVLRIAKSQYRRSKSLAPSGFQPVKIEMY